MTNVVKSASAALNADEWLNHDDGGSGGSKASFFKLDFNEKPEYRFWLHPKSQVRMRWSTVWRAIRDGKLSILRWNSMEPARILEGMRWKNDDGSFEHSPTTDPFMLLQEFVNMKIASGEMDFTDEIFSWKPDDSDDETVIHAGGFTGLFQSQKLSNEQRDAMRDIHVKQTEAYLEDGRPREETVFIVVDNENPDAGPQILTVSRGISKAIKQKISDRKTEFSKNPDKANPFKYPVCWSVKKVKNPNGGPPTYVAVVTDDDITEAIQEAFDTEVPNTDKLFEYSNVVQLRREFESTWTHKLVPDWDAIFANAEELVKGTPAGEEPTSFNYGKNAKNKNEASDDDSDEQETPKTEEKEEDGGQCEKCEKMIPVSSFTDNGAECPHCGAKYVKKGDEYELVKEEPKKPMIKASRRPKE